MGKTQLTSSTQAQVVVSCPVGAIVEVVDVSKTSKPVVKKVKGHDAEYVIFEDGTKFNFKDNRKKNNLNKLFVLQIPFEKTLEYTLAFNKAKKRAESVLKDFTKKANALLAEGQQMYQDIIDNAKHELAKEFGDASLKRLTPSSEYDYSKLINVKIRVNEHMFEDHRFVAKDNSGTRFIVEDSTGNLKRVTEIFLTNIKQVRFVQEN
jgi:hypothetical protein